MSATGGCVGPGIPGLNTDILLRFHEAQYTFNRARLLWRPCHQTRDCVSESPPSELAEACSVAKVCFQAVHVLTMLTLNSSLLKGIPTNAQLAVTLLRIGEANGSPLPPPPTSEDKVPSRPASLNQEELTLDATDKEIKQAALVKPDEHAQEVQYPPEKSDKKTLGSRILGFFRGTTASGVESKRGIDRLRAATGCHHAKNRVGVLRERGKRITPSGPVAFDARCKGKRGTVIIDSTKEPPLLYFTTDTPQKGDAQLENRKSGSVLFSMPVTDILEMRKLGGMGWKGKLVVGWALGGKEVVDGLLITGKEPGQSYQLTAMGTRNQLFNRLIAIDGQVWASC